MKRKTGIGKTKDKEQGKMERVSGRHYTNYLFVSGVDAWLRWWPYPGIQCTYLRYQMKSSSHGISLNVVQNVRVLLAFCFFVFVGLSSSGDEGRETVLNQEARVGASYRKKINCYRAVATDQVPGGGRDMEGGGSLGKVWVKRRTGRLAYFNENGFRIYANRFFFFFILKRCIFCAIK